MDSYLSDGVILVFPDEVVEGIEVLEYLAAVTDEVEEEAGELIQIDQLVCLTHGVNFIDKM